VRGLPAHLAGLQRCLVMGVVNVTPDSFSDGGRWLDAGAATAHGTELLAQGADIVDVGGESTRPGAARVPADEEQRRVLPVIEALAARGAVVSVDTMRADTARRALDAGARVGQRRQRRAGRRPAPGRGRQQRACRTSSCTGAATVPTCPSAPGTATWWPT
jgi:hypothetical protein